MTEKYELRLCSNGVYYLYEDYLINQDISFDKFNRESAKELVLILNKQNKEIEDLLNEKEEKIKQLEKELSEMKDKAYKYGECLIWERSSTINEDTEKLRIEIYGKEKAEQLKKQEIEEDKKLYTRKATIHDIKPVWER